MESSKTMTLYCKNICLNTEYGHKKYVRNIKETQYKKCSTCSIYIKYDGCRCPCCSQKLSTRCNNNKARQRARGD